MRVYSGKVSKGDFITNSTSGKRTRVPRLVRIHSDELEDIQSAVRAALIWQSIELFDHSGELAAVGSRNMLAAVNGAALLRCCY
jgi:translation elongation factor EF-G